jgi:hypothetical protein
MPLLLPLGRERGRVSQPLTPGSLSVVKVRYALVCRIENTVRSNFPFLKAADLCPERGMSKAVFHICEDDF